MTRLRHAHEAPSAGVQSNLRRGFYQLGITLGLAGLVGGVAAMPAQAEPGNGPAVKGKKAEAEKKCNAAALKMTPEDFIRLDEETTKKGYREIDNPDAAKKDPDGVCDGDCILVRSLANGKRLFSFVFNKDGVKKYSIALNNTDNIALVPLTSLEKKYEEETGKKSNAFRAVSEETYSERFGTLFKIHVTPVTEKGEAPDFSVQALPFRQFIYVVKGGKNTKEGEVYTTEGRICREDKRVGMAPAKPK
jgi:hypothetical protein